MDTTSELLSFVPDDLLERLAISTNVNKFSKKLQGELMFKLLLYSIISEKENSLRGMQSAMESVVFNALNINSSTKCISYSSISERLSKMDSCFFEEIFNTCVLAYKESIGKEQQNIIRFDSTIVSLSGKLLRTGYQLKGGDAEKYRLLKFTVGFTNIPEALYFYKDQKYTSENVALPESILAHDASEMTSVFDRGITSRDSYDKLTSNGIQFISRINNEPKLSEHTINSLVNAIETPTLNIVSDRWVYLYTTRATRTRYPLRIIRAIKKSDGEPISFITNIDNIEPAEITHIYKSRWDIEIFFKFIKQHLNFSHLLNRSENGIKSVLYVTMTAAILLLHYKRQRKLKGFKLVRLKFAQELERDMIYNIVIICNGDPEKARKLLFPNST